MDELLKRLLTYTTPYKTEDVIKKVISEEFPDIEFEEDSVGNWYYKIGDSPNTCFTAHLDTANSVLTINKLYIDDNIVGVQTDKKEDSFSTVLGADDRAGVYAILKMIEARKTGLYVLFIGEERGGIGSSHAAKFELDRFKGITKMISLDRRGYNSIVYRQGGRSTGSEYFAELLSAEFARHKLYLMPDPTGVFTDSANFASVIQECLNLSVGYFDEHTNYEILDWRFLQETLIPALIATDFEAIEPYRKLIERKSNLENFRYKIDDDYYYYSKRYEDSLNDYYASGEYDEPAIILHSPPKDLSKIEMNPQKYINAGVKVSSGLMEELGLTPIASAFVEVPIDDSYIIDFYSADDLKKIGVSIDDVQYWSINYQ